MDLGPKEVHVWQADLEVPARTLDELRATLSGDELARAARFHFPRDRTRFIAAHAIVRNLLGGYLNASPAMLEFFEQRARQTRARR